MFRRKLSYSIYRWKKTKEKSRKSIDNECPITILPGFDTFNLTRVTVMASELYGLVTKEMMHVSI